MARQENLRMRGRSEIRQLMRRLNQAQLKIVYTYAGPGMDFSRVPESIWIQFRKQIQEEMYKVLLVLFILSFSELLRTHGSTLIGGLLNSIKLVLGQEFAQKKSEKFSEDYIENTTKRLSELPAEPTREETQKVVREVFGIDRSERVAITEGNAAITAGEVGYAQVANDSQSGFVLVPVWKHKALRPRGHSRSTIDPCVVCSPLEGLQKVSWPSEFKNGPPAHPNCDCYLEWEIVPRT